MYYRLKEPWAFRGWKLLPFALRAGYGEHKHDEPLFFKRDEFLALLSCNGEEDVDLSSLGEQERKVIEQLTHEGLIESSEELMTPLEPWQHHTIYPSRYLRSVHWSITGRCNYNCRHCLVSAPDHLHPQLPLEDCFRIVDQIAGCGVNNVMITGGEPLVRSDFERIAEALSRRGIDISVLFTNASLLTDETLDMLEKHHQHPTFQLSFDGLGHHDWLRGVDGSEEQVDRALHLLQNRGYFVKAAMCIHKENKESLPATVRYLAGLGVKSLRVNAPQELGIWKQNKDEYALTIPETWEVYKDAIWHFFEDGMPLELELDGFFACKQGQTDYRVSYVHSASEDEDWSRYPYCEAMLRNAYIGSDGSLAPCMGFADTAMKNRFPNVLETPLGKLTMEGFYHDMVGTKVSDLLAGNPECRSCEHLSYCHGGCMLAGITDDGDYLVPDPVCCYFHKYIGQNAVREVTDAAISRFCR